MQFQADLLGCEVLRPVVRETTALGTACLAGLGCGMWADTDEIERQWTLDRRFSPDMAAQQRDEATARWRRAVDRSRGWLADDVRHMEGKTVIEPRL